MISQEPGGPAEAEGRRRVTIVVTVPRPDEPDRPPAPPRPSPGTGGGPGDILPPPLRSRTHRRLTRAAARQAAKAARRRASTSAASVGRPVQRRRVGRTSASQLASIRWPPWVSTDSGWNCTPSIGSVAVPHRHHHAGLGPRRSPRSRRAASSRQHGERVVPGRGERVGQPGEHARARRGAPARSCRAAAPAPGSTVPPNAAPIAWWPEAHAEDRQLARRTRLIRSMQMPARSGVPGPGESRTPAAPSAADVGQRDLVVAPHVALDAELAEVLHEVEDERVVVVDHEDAHGSPARSGAGCRSRWSTGCRGRPGRTRAGRRDRVDRGSSPPPGSPAVARVDLHVVERQQRLGPREHHEPEQAPTTAATRSSEPIELAGQRRTGSWRQIHAYTGQPPSSAGPARGLAAGCGPARRARSAAGSCRTSGCRWSA